MKRDGVSGRRWFSVLVKGMLAVVVGAGLSVGVLGGRVAPASAHSPESGFTSVSVAHCDSIIQTANGPKPVCPTAGTGTGVAHCDSIIVTANGPQPVCPTSGIGTGVVQCDSIIVTTDGQKPVCPAPGFGTGVVQCDSIIVTANGPQPVCPGSPDSGNTAD